MLQQSHLTASKERFFISPRNVRSIEEFPASGYKSLTRMGIGFDGVDGTALRKMRDRYLYAKNIERMALAAMDAIQPTITTASLVTPIQFLQEWLPGFVKIITAARKIDELVGVSTIGSWEMAQIVQGVMELTGTAQPYGDFVNVPFSSWNVNFQYRTIVRFEEGLRVGRLESAQAARIEVDSGGAKREAAALALEIVRNSLGFYGFNSGANNTYGFLNDPGLPAYVPAAAGVGGTTWATKTYLEINKDLRTMIQTIRAQSKDVIDVSKTPMTLALATSVRDYLSVTSDFGNSVWDWLKETYSNIRVVSAPELDAANSGANVGYLYAETVADNSTDGGKTFIQVVPARFQTLGVQQRMKTYVEDYTMASAGIMCKRPWAVTRITGI